MTIPFPLKPLRHAVLFATVAVLAGCATLEPEALKPAEIAETVKADRQTLRQGVEPVQGPVTLEEAIARALKYGADKRLKALEEAVAYGTFEAGNFDMLPKLVASAGYRDRSNDMITRSRDSVTGAPSLAHPSISSSRDAITTELGFSWSLLDFGQSYYAAKQNADRVLVAQERRRRALHILVQDVRTAYWRMVAAQALRDKVRTAISVAEEALGDARKAENERLRNPLEPLRYQLQVLESIKLLETIEQELSTARVDLAALINIPFIQEIRVSEPPMATNKRWLETPIEELEEQALMHNAELRESIYNARIARQETRRTLLKLFPGLSFNYSSKRSDDEYLINKSWNETGAQLSFNLLGLFSAPAQMRLADAGVAVADQRRMVTQLAVLTQVHLARQQYTNALRQFERTDTIANVEGRITQHVINQEKAEKQTRFERVARDTSLILAQLRRYHAFSNTQSAASRLQASLGMDLAITGETDRPLDDLTREVQKALEAWNTTPQQAAVAPAIEQGTAQAVPSQAAPVVAAAVAAPTPAVAPAIEANATPATSLLHPHAQASANTLRVESVTSLNALSFKRDLPNRQARLAWRQAVANANPEIFAKRKHIGPSKIAAGTVLTLPAATLAAAETTGREATE